MLIRRQGYSLRMVTHYDHAGLSGRLARRWGHDRFQAPTPSSSFVHAVTHHDDAWHAADDLPRYDERTKRPLHFLDFPISEQREFYGRPIAASQEVDLYASLLMGMHWVGLYNHRWGMQEPRAPVLRNSAIDELKREMTTQEEKRWASIKLDAWGLQGERAAFELNLWHNYAILEALDELSLALCLLDPEHPSDGDPVQVDATLRPVDQPPGGRSIENVPLAAGGERVRLILQVPEPRLLTIDPYPLNGEIDVEVPVRMIEDRDYEQADQLAESYRASREHSLRWHLRAGG